MASVMQQLIDITPLPTLFMRTVIQSVTMYNKLAGFVLIIMQRLVDKQIWKNPKVWEGFVICLQRIPLQSPQILLKLPETQLGEVLTSAPDLKKHLVKHVQSLNAQQVSIQNQPLETPFRLLLTKQNFFTEMSDPGEHHATYLGLEHSNGPLGAPFIRKQ